MEDLDIQKRVIDSLEEQRQAVEDFKAKHFAEVDALRDQVRAIEAKGNRPGNGAESAEWKAANESSGWYDAKGEAVRVLRPGDLWGEAKGEGIALGDAVRAMITGARNDHERKALSEGTASAGGYTVPAPLATWFIDRLRSKSVAIAAGAMTVPMDSNTLAIAQLATDPAVAWRAENSDIAEGDPTFGRVQLTARSLAGLVKVSRELLADTVNAGAIIEQALLKVMALELDRAAIYGDGTNDSPTGIVNVSGINEVSMGANGAAITSYDSLIDALYELQADNVPKVSAGIMNPRTGVALAKLKDTTGNPLVAPKMVADVPLMSTTAAPINETQGTATNCSSIVFGDFSQLMIGMREQINIRILDQVFANKGQVGILVHTRADVQLAHKASFSRLKGIKP